PESGRLAGGDIGAGRLADPARIVEVAAAVLDHIGGHPRAPGRGAGDLAGRRVLVTAGPTREAIDPVRFIGNRSSGRMGYAVAEEAASRGASVILVAGPVSLPDPPRAEVVHVETAEQMLGAVSGRLEGVDAVVKAAAVADWRPQLASGEKMKKESGPPNLELVPTVDILKELGARKEGFVLVG